MQGGGVQLAGWSTVCGMGIADIVGGVAEGVGLEVVTWKSYSYWNGAEMKLRCDGGGAES